MPIKEIEVKEATTIDFICPICGSDIQDTDEVMMGDKDDYHTFNPNLKNFTMIHSKCFTEETTKNAKENINNISGLERSE